LGCGEPIEPRRGFGLLEKRKEREGRSGMKEIEPMGWAKRRKGKESEGDS
jgi:hypothetical protein